MRKTIRLHSLWKYTQMWMHYTDYRFNKRRQRAELFREVRAGQEAPGAL